MLDKNMTWKPHQKYATGKVAARLKQLKLIIGCRNIRILENKRVMYLLMVRLITMYESPEWESCAQSALNKYQINQNKALRIFAGA